MSLTISEQLIESISYEGFQLINLKPSVSMQYFKHDATRMMTLESTETVLNRVFHFNHTQWFFLNHTKLSDASELASHGKDLPESSITVFSQSMLTVRAGKAQIILSLC